MSNESMILNQFLVPARRIKPYRDSKKFLTLLTSGVNGGHGRRFTSNSIDFTQYLGSFQDKPQ